MRTGRLRDSVSILRQEELAVTVGSEVSYAGFVEFGTSGMMPRSYLRPAIITVTPRLREALGRVGLELLISYADGSRAFRILGWKLKVTLEETVKRYCDRYRTGLKLTLLERTRSCQHPLVYRQRDSL